jgi:hypothetical protein
MAETRWAGAGSDRARRRGQKRPRCRRDGDTVSGAGGRRIAPTRGLFLHVKRISPGDRDSLAERSEFELPVPVSKLSDDNVVL